MLALRVFFQGFNAAHEKRGGEKNQAWNMTSPTLEVCIIMEIFEVLSDFSFNEVGWHQNK